MLWPTPSALPSVSPCSTTGLLWYALIPLTRNTGMSYGLSAASALLHCYQCTTRLCADLHTCCIGFCVCHDVMLHTYGCMLLSLRKETLRAADSKTTACVCLSDDTGSSPQWPQGKMHFSSSCRNRFLLADASVCLPTHFVQSMCCCCRVCGLA